MQALLVSMYTYMEVIIPNAKHLRIRHDCFNKMKDATYEQTYTSSDYFNAAS